MIGRGAFREHQAFQRDSATRSMSRGASHSGISQSAASQHVQEVERRLGVALLDRTKRPLELDAGRQALRRALPRRAAPRGGVSGSRWTSLKAHVEGTVRVASIYSIGLSEMSRLQEEFSAPFPERAAARGVPAARQDLRSGAGRPGRSGTGQLSGGDQELAVIPWREEEMKVAASPSHPLGARRRCCCPPI